MKTRAEFYILYFMAIMILTELHETLLQTICAVVIVVLSATLVAWLEQRGKK